MVLIVVSFAMLLAIISTVVNNYSVNAKADLVAQSAHTASAYIEEKLQQADSSTQPTAPTILFQKVSPSAMLTRQQANLLLFASEKTKLLKLFRLTNTKTSAICLMTVFMKISITY